MPHRMTRSAGPMGTARLHVQLVALNATLGCNFRLVTSQLFGPSFAARSRRSRSKHHVAPAMDDALSPCGDRIGFFNAPVAS